MTKKRSSWPSSGTAPTPTAVATPTGTGHSTTGYAPATPPAISSNVVALAVKAAPDHDAILSLPERLGSSLEGQYGHEKQDFSIVGYVINAELSLAELEEGRNTILSCWIAPTDQMIAEGLARLRSLTASRASTAEDFDLATSAYADKLREYPDDAVRIVLAEAPDRSKWWPTWFELRERLEYHTRHRRLILRAIDHRISRKSALAPRNRAARLVRKAIKRG